MQTFRLRRLHLLSSNARIYIAQECTTRGSRRLHLLMQEHNPRHACTKKIHAPQIACTKRRMHPLGARPGDARVDPHTRVKDIRAPTSYARSRDTRATAPHARVQGMRASPLCLHAPKMAASTDARAKMHAPLLLASQRCACLGN